jgi:hypothetical protein
MALSLAEDATRRTRPAARTRSRPSAPADRPPAPGAPARRGSAEPVPAPEVAEQDAGDHAHQSEPGRRHDQHQPPVHEPVYATQAWLRTGRSRREAVYVGKTAGRRWVTPKSGLDAVPESNRDSTEWQSVLRGYSYPVSPSCQGDGGTAQWQVIRRIRDGP